MAIGDLLTALREANEDRLDILKERQVFLLETYELKEKLREARAAIDAHPVHEACPACLANRESLRKRGERAEEKLRDAERKIAELEGRAR